MEIKTTTVKMTTDIEVIPMTAPFIASIVRYSDDVRSIMSDLKNDNNTGESDEEWTDDKMVDYMKKNTIFLKSCIDARQFKALSKTIELLDALEKAFGVAE